MPSRRRLPLALAPAALALLAITGCGGGEKPARVVTRTVVRTVTTPATTPATTPTTTTPAATQGTISLRQAELIVGGNAATVLTERDWRPDQTLKVLIGVRHAAGEGGREQAFFFVGGHYIGTDTSDPSGRIAVVDQRDDAITLAYGLYRPGDAIESPSAGTAHVTYAWDGTRLVPQGSIPPSALDAAQSRR